MKKLGHRCPYRQPSLLWCLLRVFRGRFLHGSFLKLLHDLAQFVGPLTLSQLIGLVGDKRQPAALGYLYSLLLLLAAAVQTCALQHYFNRMGSVGARVRTCLMGLIYRKVSGAKLELRIQNLE